MKNYTPKPEIVGKPTLPSSLGRGRLTNSIALFILLAVLTFSCQSPTNSTETSASSDTPVNLTAMMAPFTPKTQTFTVSGKKPSIVTGKAGTKIHVEPNNLTMPDGSPIEGEIQVNLIECTKKSELLGAGLQTVSDGKLLESGGSYYIDMEADGQKLEINEGKSVNVEFPKITDKNMELFYGQKDETGQMNWDAADVDFRNAKSQPTPEEMSESSASTFSVQSDTIYSYVSGKDTVISTKIDDIWAYLEGEDAKHTKKELREYNNEQARQARQEKAAREKSEREERARADKMAKAQSLLDRQNSSSISATGERLINVSQNYLGQNLNRFGWFNCDRFLENEKTAMVSVNMPESPEARIIYYVMKDINAIISIYEYPHTNYAAPVSLPDNQQVDIFVVQGQDDQKTMGFAHTTITTGKDAEVSIEPKKTQMADIEAAFGAI